MMLHLCIFLLFVATAWAGGCPCGSDPVGVELGADGPIPDSSMTASSEINKWHRASQGRLNNYKGKQGVSRGVGAWCANKSDDVVDRFLQVDLGTTRKIGEIGTQGRNNSGTLIMFVKNYRITYSTDGVTFSKIYDVPPNEKIFQGNSDKNSIVYNDLPSPNTKPIEARYIRVHPEEFDGNICMRVEFYECDEG